MKLYRFRQNNSGGSFVCDSEVNVNVYIQADNADEANNLAEDIGIYFNGVDEGHDCECCGDRWWPADDYSAITEPKELIEQFDNYGYKKFEWQEQKGIDAIVHTKDNYAHRILMSGVVKSDSKSSSLLPKITHQSIESFAEYLFSE